MKRDTRIPECSSVSIIASAFLLATVAAADPIFLESGGQLVVEGETFSSRTPSTTHEWLVVPGEVAGFPSEFTEYRGEGYVQARPEGSGGGIPLAPPFIEYKVRINTVGTYRLYVRWVGPNNDADTFYASIAELSDGGGGEIADWYRYIRISESFSFAAAPTWFGSGGFERTDSPYSNGETPVVWNIAAPGDYTVRFNMREDGAAIDAFVFQLSSLPAPTGIGPQPSEVTTAFAITTLIPPLVLGAEFSLPLVTKGSVAPVDWSVIDGALPIGMALSVNGVFSGRPTELGESTFTVQVTDGDRKVAEKIYTVDVLLVLPPPDIQIQQASATAVPGRVIDQFVTVTNIGSEAVEDIQIVEMLDETLELRNIHPEGATDGATLEESTVILWDVGSLSPNERAILTNQVLINPATPLGEDIKRPVCDSSQVHIILSCIDDVQSSVPSECFASDCAVFLTGLYACAGQPFTLGCAGLLGTLWLCANRCDLEGSVAALECIEGIGCDFRRNPPTIPVDPNEKLVVAKRFIQPDQTLTYAIHFENIGTVEALDVFVTDLLDTNLDDSTLEILTPEGASYGAATRTLRWELLGRNLLPGETDNVLMAISPMPGLADGTEIRNSAEIQFEIFDTLITPEVVNIIDTTKPECVVDTLPAETPTEEFTVTWTGKDVVGEIDAYTVFVSANGEGFVPLVQETESTTTQIVGEDGSTYAFLCAARDTAGNTEEASLAPEASTKIRVRSGTVWPRVYERIFLSDEELNTFRAYRDKVLAENATGRLYTKFLYSNGDEVYRVLMENPQLMERMSRLVAENREALNTIVQGGEGRLENPDEISRFLHDFAKKSPWALQKFTNNVRLELLRHQSSGEPLFGFVIE